MRTVRLLFIMLGCVASPMRAVSQENQCAGTPCVRFGGTIRQRYERVRDTDWGRGLVDTDGYLLQRYMLHADSRVNQWRFFTELTSNHVMGRNGGARPVDADRLDLHQVFLDVPIAAATMRLGRQELMLGSERLVSVRDGTNVRATFDGARVMTTARAWRFDAFALAPVQTIAGSFDNRFSAPQRFWGAQVSQGSATSRMGTDIYYLGMRRESARFEQGIGRELRHSIGIRAFGRTSPIDYDIEIVQQWGTFGSGRIRAWTFASNVGFTTDAIPRSTRFGLKADVTSGDENPADASLQTFNPLFPRGGYFGAASLIGPMNHVDLHPSVDVYATNRLTLGADWDFFCRESIHDGQYAISGVLQVPSNGSGARRVGHQLSGTVTYKINRRANVLANYGHFFAGPFLVEARGSSVDYMTIWLDYRL
jgi:hypothetical protein